MQFKLLLEIKLPVVLFPLIHCFDCIFFLLHDSHHALLSITYFEKTVKSSVLSILSLQCMCYFFMFKARGSSMKRGSFNKKRSVKRKSTKVCVVIISDVKKILWFVNGRVHFLFASQSSLCHWSQQHYRMIMFDLLITTDALISSDYFSESQYCYVQFNV